MCESVNTSSCKVHTCCNKTDYKQICKPHERNNRNISNCAYKCLDINAINLVMIKEYDWLYYHFLPPLSSKALAESQHDTVQYMLLLYL